MGSLVSQQLQRQDWTAMVALIFSITVIQGVRSNVRQFQVHRGSALGAQGDLQVIPWMPLLPPGLVLVPV